MTMKTNWRKIIIEIAIWLFTEVLLNIAGLDDLGNYSEFVFAQKNIGIFNSTPIALMV
jgi:hypothetical protein